MTRTGWKSLNPEKTLERDGIDLYNQLTGHVAHDKTLHVGDEIKLESGEYVEISQVLSRSGGEYNMPLYNFHVENDPSYYANGYLVHNKNGPKIGSYDPSINGGTPAEVVASLAPEPGTGQADPGVLSGEEQAYMAFMAGEGGGMADIGDGAYDPESMGYGAEGGANEGLGAYTGGEV